MPSARSRKCSRGLIPVRSRNSVSGKKFSYCRASHPHKPSKGWKRQSPHRKSEKRLLLDRCGSKAFLMPKSLKFPVVSVSQARNRKCAISPKGTLAAYQRAQQYGYPGIAKKAHELAKKQGFSWVHK